MNNKLTLEQLNNKAYSLAGIKISKLASQLNIQLPQHIKNNKGAIGELIEKALGANNTNRIGPDFIDLGIELKTIPVDKNAIPKESTFVATINLMDPNYLTWQDSLVRKKLIHVLWVPIIFNGNENYHNATIGCPLFWNMPPEIEQTLKKDYDELMHMLAIGKISEITAKYGEYLQIRPKAQNHIANTVAINEDAMITPTLRRAFYLRRSFTSMILQQGYVCN